MNPKGNRCKPWHWLIIVAFFIAWLIVVPILTIRSSIKDVITHKSQIESLYGDVFFSGKVVGFHCIKHSGMPSAAILCIKIDSSNVDSFYQYDKYTALKIENGMATFPIGQYAKATDDTLYKEIVYVNINEGKSLRMLFINTQNDTIVKQLYYTSSDLIENDLNICDTCY